MESSGRNGDDAERPAGDGSEPVRLPIERSPEGRFVIRSSSHPPTDQTSPVDSSGVHSRPQTPAPPKAADSDPAPTAREPDRSRPGRSTPAERPRKRKELKQGSTYMADVRARCDTPRALPGSRISDRPSRATSAAQEHSLPEIAALAAAPASSSQDAVRAVDEVTRRVRRPPLLDAAPPPVALDPRLPWRAVAAAGVIAALFLFAVWFLG